MAGFAQSVVFFLLNLYGLWLWSRTIPAVAVWLNMVKNFAAILFYE